MAYRFMLEVPESERKAAEIQVGAAPDTQILVTRASFAAGFDMPFAALSIAAGSLRVVDSIYAWFSEFGGSPQQARIVLHSGERLLLAEHTAGSMIAAIRADQPWVEHTIPRIGDHDHEEFATGSTVAHPETARTSTSRGVTIDHVNFVAISVMDLRRAEEFYAEFFELQVVGRTRTDAAGKYHLLPNDYVWERAIVTETMADDAYVRNGKLALGLHRVSPAARLDRNIIDRISIQVDAASYRRMKAKALVNAYELLGETQDSFRFRDPFGVPWEISLPGLVPPILRESLGS